MSLRKVLIAPDEYNPDDGQVERRDFPNYQLFSDKNVKITASDYRGIPSRVRLTDEIVTLIVKAGIKNSECNFHWDFDFVSDGSLSKRRPNVGPPSLDRKGRIYVFRDYELRGHRPRSDNDRYHHIEKPTARLDARKLTGETSSESGSDDTAPVKQEESPKDQKGGAKTASKRKTLDGRSSLGQSSLVKKQRQSAQTPLRATRDETPTGGESESDHRSKKSHTKSARLDQRKAGLSTPDRGRAIQPAQVQDRESDRERGRNPFGVGWARRAKGSDGEFLAGFGSLASRCDQGGTPSGVGKPSYNDLLNRIKTLEKQNQILEKQTRTALRASAESYAISAGYFAELKSVFEHAEKLSREQKGLVVSLRDMGKTIVDTDLVLEHAETFVEAANDRVRKLDETLRGVGLEADWERLRAEALDMNKASRKDSTNGRVSAFDWAWF